MQTHFTEEDLKKPHIREADRVLRTCVHCGFCNATCPTYQLLGDERDGPRGRIYLMKEMLEAPEGADKVTEETRLHLDRCLTCRNCETTCPSGVEYHKLRDIGRAGEFGVKLSWRMGDMTSYGAIRKGFGGHHGVTGELGAKYRYEVNDRLTLWTGAELGLGDQDFVGTYFGVDGNESRPGRAAHSPDGGAYIARVSVEARYEFMPDTALMGRLTYGRLLGDAGDSPLVQTRSQPSISIGVARRLNFRF